TVQVTSDLATEGNETFNAVLSNPTNSASLGTASAAGTIIDDDVPVYTLLAASATEGTPPGAGGVITFTVTRDRADPGPAPATVQFATTILGGNTASGSDFTQISTDGTLTFGLGGGAANTQTFTVQITPDAVFEGNETFTALIRNPAGGAVTG